MAKNTVKSVEPILIEYKGYEDKLVKLDSEGNVANRTAKNQPDFTNIKCEIWKGEKTPKKECALQDGATTKDINNRIVGHHA